MTREERRLGRQFDKLESLVPGLRGRMGMIRARGAGLVRLPLALILIFGGVFSFLPVLGLWMLPFGLLLLAIDLPFLRPHVNAALIRGRRRLELLRRRWAARRRQ